MVLVGSVLHGQLLVASLRTHVRRTSSRGHTRANSRILGFSSSLDTGLARRATPLDPLRAAANLRSCAVRIHDVGGRLGCSPPFSRLTPPPRDPGVGGCLDRKRFLVRILARFDRGNASGSNPGSARGRHALSMGTDEPVGWVPGLSLPPTAGDRPRGIDRYLVRKISMMSPRISMVGPARDLSIHPGPRSPPLEWEGEGEGAGAILADRSPSPALSQRGSNARFLPDRRLVDEAFGDTSVLPGISIRDSPPHSVSVSFVLFRTESRDSRRRPHPHVGSGSIRHRHHVQAVRAREHTALGGRLSSLVGRWNPSEALQERREGRADGATGKRRRPASGCVGKPSSKNAWTDECSRGTLHDGVGGTNRLYLLVGSMEGTGFAMPANQDAEGGPGGDLPKIGRRCFVGNLAWSTSWQDLKDHFRDAGTVVYCNVTREPSGESKRSDPRPSEGSWRFASQHTRTQD